MPGRVLPARTDVEREIRRLVDRVRAHGGAARVLRITFEDAREEEQLVSELQAARDDESFTYDAAGEILSATDADFSRGWSAQGSGCRAAPP